MEKRKHYHVIVFFILVTKINCGAIYHLRQPHRYTTDTIGSMLACIDKNALTDVLGTCCQARARHWVRIEQIIMYFNNTMDNNSKKIKHALILS